MPVSTYKSIAYQGTNALPSQIGADAVSRVSPRGIPFTIDWTASFNAAQGSPVNFGVALNPATAQFDRLKSLYVNNKNNLLPVTVYCPDTQYQFTVQGGVQGWYPVFTASTAITVYIEGMNSGFAAFNFSTLVHLFNIDARPFVDLPSGGPIIQNDTIVSANFLWNTGAPTFLLANVPATGFMNIVSIWVWIPGGYTNFPQVSLVPPSITSQSISGGAATIILNETLNIRVAAGPINLVCSGGAANVNISTRLRYQYPVQ